MVATPPIESARAGERGVAVHVVNLGCKVNRVESDWMETSFVDAGARLAPEDAADVVVVNTCAVTGEAQAKTRKAVRRAAMLPKRPLVVACGCVASLFPDELESIAPNVRVLTDKTDLANKTLSLLHPHGTSSSETHVPYDAGTLDAAGARGDDAENVGAPAAARAPHAAFRAKRGVKIQDGCDNKCTYCIVWRARGASRSTPVDSIDAQVRRVLEEGASQVVLSGVNLAKYRGDDRAPDLAALLDRIVALGVGSLRIGSVEPPDVTEGLARTMARLSDVVCPHLHIPLQSGSDSVLERMGRTYTSSQFAATVAMLRAHVPSISITTDVIAGFPGETDEEHAESMAFCRSLGFAKMHVFRYSARPMTEAATMAGQVEPAVMRSRSEELRDLSLELRVADASSRVGSEERVLIERIDARGGAWGTTASYHEVFLPAGSHSMRAAGIAKTRLTGLLEGGPGLLGAQIGAS